MDKDEYDHIYNKLIMFSYYGKSFGPFAYSVI